jgi:hypothetical protein
VVLRSNRAPAVVGWLTLGVAALQAGLVILATVGGPDLGPAVVISGWLWFLGIGITLIIRSVSTREPAGMVVPATAS